MKTAFETARALALIFATACGVAPGAQESDFDEPPIVLDAGAIDDDDEPWGCVEPEPAPEPEPLPCDEGTD